MARLVDSGQLSLAGQEEIAEVSQALRAFFQEGLEVFELQNSFIDLQHFERSM